MVSKLHEVNFTEIYFGQKVQNTNKRVLSCEKAIDEIGVLNINYFMTNKVNWKNLNRTWKGSDPCLRLYIFDPGKYAFRNHGNFIPHSSSNL